MCGNSTSSSEDTTNDNSLFGLLNINSDHGGQHALKSVISKIIQFIQSIDLKRSILFISTINIINDIDDKRNFIQQEINQSLC